MIAATAKIASDDNPINRIDVKDYILNIKKFARKRNYSIIELGNVYLYPILLLKPKNYIKRCLDGKKNILVIAGFHGNEIAGPFGLLKFLQEADDSLFEENNISFIPLVNPTGFRKIVRTNRWNQVPNRGYVFSELNCDVKPAKEDKILLNNIKYIIETGRDGILSLHEDIDAECFYCYAYDSDNKKIIHNIIKTAKEHFEIMPDGRKALGFVDGGVVWDLLDGSFDHFVWLLGIPILTTETPAKQELSKRADAVVDLIKSFINSTCAT
jgi:hypothetical protein